ncbi:MAG: 30S ribosomal protein S8 [Candidatus Atribacteria bacterium]|nr:MAG: 30S ribosomal protein S8 [Candidatus Atribacteria bacterium]
MIPYPIGDMLTRIRNANSCFHPSVSMPHSKMKEAVAKVLESEGYIRGIEVVAKDPQPELKIQLKYQGDRADTVCAINSIHLVSKPSRRVYVGKDNVPQPLAGMGISIISTSQGIISGKEAKVRGIGGEVLCVVW